MVEKKPNVFIFDHFAIMLVRDWLAARRLGILDDFENALFGSQSKGSSC